MKSVSCGFDSRSGYMIFFGICSVIIPQRHIKVSLSDDELKCVHVFLYF